MIKVTSVHGEYHRRKIEQGNSSDNFGWNRSKVSCMTIKRAMGHVMAEGYSPEGQTACGLSGRITFKSGTW